jgi:hypothetical protein
MHKFKNRDLVVLSVWSYLLKVYVSFLYADVLDSQGVHVVKQVIDTHEANRISPFYSRHALRFESRQTKAQRFQLAFDLQQR